MKILFNPDEIKFKAYMKDQPGKYIAKRPDNAPFLK